MSEIFESKFTFSISAEDKKLYDNYGDPAKELAKEGNFLSAIKLIDEILTESPNAGFALILKANYLFNHINKNLKFDRITQNNIGSIKKQALNFKNQFKECINLIDKALKINPENKEAKEFKNFIENPLKEIDDFIKLIETTKIKISNYEPDKSVIEAKLIYTNRGYQMWEIELRHDGLNKYRHIRGNDKYVVEQKAAAQQAIWDKMWQKKLEIEQKQSKIELAIEQTKEATEAIKEIENIIKHALNKNYKIDWESLKNESKFLKQKPQPPKLLDIPKPPNKNAPYYQPKIGFWDKIILSREQEKIAYAENIFNSDYGSWLKTKEEIISKNKELEKQYQDELRQWEAEEREFLLMQKRKNEIYEQYFNKQPNTIIPYCKIILSNSEYPHYFPQEFDLDYNPTTKILIVDYSLPSVDDIPKLKEVKYVKSKDELVEIILSESAINKLYDNLIYQIALRTIHELYESDVVNAIDSIVFNGWVESLDKAIGHKTDACIVSVQANRHEFLSINLSNIDPKLCFKNLKGVGSSKLHSLTPIAPILNISREDKRFISSYDVAGELDDTYNLAAMDWEDFEHLIRELFEKEFSQYGGEVKVTRASRDHGVDAVAFDPDPIRGGKIVIQAKRYTNTVGVSAVRDLYGTVMNEGATKGILVTTADYGPDAYEFARGKPLTLLNGSNLLHLLEKHGHKAKIDLKAAKQILSEKERQL